MTSFFVPHNLDAPIARNAEGPLAGLTAVVKDMYDMVGTRTGGGNPEWLAAQKPAKRNAATVERILNAGAIITGKTVCDEFFYSVSGMNAHYGTPQNIRGPGRVSGGSSSGSAAACSAGVCDFALGSDTGGSVRIPASFNGLFGLRPTHGRVDLSGAMAMAPSFDVAGWFATGPGVFRRVGDVLLQGHPVKGTATRLLVATDAFLEAEPGVVALCREFLARASIMLPPAENTTLAPKGFDTWREAFRVVQAWEVWDTFGAFVTKTKPNLGPGIRERMEFAASVTDDEAALAREVATVARDHIRGLLSPGTIAALPTAPSIAPLLSATHEELELFRAKTMRLTCTAGLAGLPQVNIPAGTVTGCPAGISFIGWPGGDEALLELSCQLAHLCGISIS